MLCRLAAIFALVISTSLSTRAPAQTRLAESVHDELSCSLKSLGYSVVELERMVSGHLIATVRINDSENLRFVCDSGSYGTLLAPQTCENLGLEARNSGTTTGGVGGTGVPVSKATLRTFEIGLVKQQVSEILVIDISEVNRQFKAIGEEPVHGIIGSDWMAQYQALLDVANKRMFFKAGEPGRIRNGK